jgi:hypothetical protein
VAKLIHREYNAMGVLREMTIDEKGNVEVNLVQDLEPLVEQNKRAQLERGKRITSDYANPIGTIPHVIALKWLREEGWWWMDADQDPAVDKKLKEKLNSSEWRWLRNSELRV